jgi:hypothetical protein
VLLAAQTVRATRSSTATPLYSPMNNVGGVPGSTTGAKGQGCHVNLVHVEAIPPKERHREISFE